MAEKSDLGLPERGDRNHSGMISVKATTTDWELILLLKHHWEKQCLFPITTSDVFRAALRFTASAMPEHQYDIPSAGEIVDVQPVIEAQIDAGTELPDHSKKKPGRKTKTKIRKSY